MKMKLNELTGEFEKRQTICQVDGNSITYHDREMQHIDGNLYREQTEDYGYSQCCMLYVCYSGQKIAMEIEKINADCNVEETVEMCKKLRLDTQDAFVQKIKRYIENQKRIQLLWIEYLKYIAPSWIESYMESRKIFAEKQEQINKEQRKQTKAKNQKFVAERNAEAEKAVAAAIETIRNGGTLKNETIVLYRGSYDIRRYSIVNYLMQENGVNVPNRTQGWINENLMQMEISEGIISNVCFWKSEHGKGSKKFYQYMYELLHIIRAENR